MRSTLDFAISLLALPFVHGSFVRRPNGLRHEAKEAAREVAQIPNQAMVTNYTTMEQYSAPTMSSSILSLVYTSPNATPVEITAQSQVVTSYIPEMTWCVGPPMALIPLTGPPYANQSTTQYSTIINGTNRCETMYTPTTSTVCATTLTGLATKVIVSECDQEITFSSECGFTLETPTPVTTNASSLITPAPTVKKRMTYWLAPWQSLTAGDTPSDVDIKVCDVLENDRLECTSLQEVWEVVVVTSTTTTSRTLQLSTTVSGPGILIIETVQATITDTIETLDLSTTMLLETEVEIESTSKASKLGTVPSFGGAPAVEEPTTTVYDGPVETTYITKEVMYKSSSSSSSSTPNVTTTVYTTTTVTKTLGTVTKTMSRLMTSGVENATTLLD